MTDRYESIRADCEIKIAHPGTVVGDEYLDDSNFGLILGYAGGSDHILIRGTRDDLDRLLRRATHLVALKTCPTADPS